MLAQRRIVSAFRLAESLGAPAEPSHFYDYKDLPAEKRVSLCSSFNNPKVSNILTCEPARTPALLVQKLQKQKPVPRALPAKRMRHQASRRHKLPEV
jgi:hypothetical protein